MDLSLREGVFLRAKVPRTLDGATVARLRAEIERPARIVVLEGEDGAFCEGLALRPDNVDPDAFEGLLAALDAVPRPVVALVDGAALGGGLALAASADLVLATPRSTFGLPEVLWGLIPAVAFPVVARRIGVARARLLAIGVPAIDAAEAHRWGLVDAVVEDPWDGLAPWARRLLRADPTAQGHARALPTLDPDGARRRFLNLLRSDTTRARLADLPWEEP